MPASDNKYVCSRCSHEFEFCPEKDCFEDKETTQVTCPKCGTRYVRKIQTFPKGYSARPHS